MRYLLCLLFVISSAFAQPIEGPYEILETDGPIEDVRIAVRENGRIDIFYEENNTIGHLLTELAENSIVAGPEVLDGAQNTYYRKIGSVLTMDDQWFALIYDSQSYDEFPNHILNRTTLFGGQNEQSFSDVLDEGEQHDYYMDVLVTDHKNCCFSLMPRNDGGFFSLWIHCGQVPIGDFGWCPHNSLSLTAFDSLGNFDQEIEAGCPVGPHGPTKVMMTPGADDDYNMLSAAVAEMNLCQWTNANGIYWDDGPEYDSEFDPVSFLEASSDEFAVLSGSSYWDTTVVGLLDQEGNCEQVLSESYFPVAVASQHGLGFAWLTKRNGHLYLSRATASGETVHSSGVVRWTDQYPITVTDLAVTPNGKIVMCWIEEDGDDSHILLAAVDWDTFLSIDNLQSVAIPSELSLSAFPNPFNSTVKLSYELATSGDVTLSIFNLHGQKVVTLVNERTAAGNHEVTWTPTISSGVYFAQLETQNISRTAKLLYIR